MPKQKCTPHPYIALDDHLIHKNPMPFCNIY